MCGDKEAETTNYLSCIKDMVLYEEKKLKGLVDEYEKIMRKRCPINEIKFVKKGSGYTTKWYKKNWYKRENFDDKHDILFTTMD